MTPRAEPVPARPRAVDPSWLELDFKRREPSATPAPARASAGLREAILRWLEQEL